MLLDKIDKEVIDKYDDLIPLLQSMGPRCKIDMDFLNLFMQRMDENKKIKIPKYKFNTPIDLSQEQQKIFNIKSTTIGRLIFNSFVLPEVYFQKIGFIDKTIDGDTYGDLHSNIALLLTNKDISSQMYCDIIDRCGWLGSTLTNFKGYTMDLDSLSVPKKFREERDKTYKTLIDNKVSGKEVLAAEDVLVNKLRSEKKDSGLSKIIGMKAKGNFSNNYKNLLVGRGILPDDTGKVEILGTDLTSGNKPAEYVKLSNNSIKGIFGRSLKTAQGGYLTKLVSQGFSYIKVSKVEDCGTPYSIKVNLTNKNIKLYLNRYIKLNNNGQLIELNINNYKDFIGKQVLMRTPMMCKCKDGICRSCYGSLIKYNKIDKGLNSLITDLTSTIMNKNMKSFHDLSTKYFSVDISKYI